MTPHTCIDASECAAVQRELAAMIDCITDELASARHLGHHEGVYHLKIALKYAVRVFERHGFTWYLRLEDRT